MDYRGALLEDGLSPSTIRNYVNQITAAESWFVAQGWDLATADASQLTAYASTKPRTFASQNLLRAALRRYWLLVEHPRPPLGALRVPPKPTMVCRALDEADARMLAAAARARHDLKGFAVLLGMYYQGLRREEIAGLGWSAFAEGWLTVVGKGQRRQGPTLPDDPGAPRRGPGA